MTVSSPTFQTGADVRIAVRKGAFTGHTVGVAPSFVQGNVVILPKAHAYDFLLFCQRNPKPCPLLAVSDEGSPRLPILGMDLDIRTDIPRYCVWRDGELVGEPAQIQDLWRDDMVTFVLGCSFSFEQALISSGLSLRHVECGDNVSMFKTNIPTVSAGPFSGPLVVTMRPFMPADVIRAVQITSRFPSVHGAPVHVGDPAVIGIRDAGRPDYGDPVEVRPGEIPVFWACGVTPQAALAAARLPLVITHAPGYMLVTDLLNERLAVF
jgi:uncharacterized protein YcsI (UPF0317 family)